MKTTKYSLLIFYLAIIMVVGCKKDDAPPTIPSVTTAPLTNITTTGATAGGTITSDGGASITASGIVLSRKNSTPTLSDTVISGTTPSGSFTSNLTNLDFNTTYYIRAYATNAVGTGYGNVVTLNTANDTTKVRFIYDGADVIYGLITSPTTGKKWMDRNLGASNVATSLTDTAGYGHLFQWGRLADGHQMRNSTTTTTLSSTDVPGHINYIISTANPDRNWRSPENNSLWQGSSGINNPCPSGWHVPTKAEWDAESITDPDIAFNRLKMTYGGFRHHLAPTAPYAAGTQAGYWASTIETTNAWAQTIFPGNTGTAGASRGLGMSLRCIKD